jgi:RNA polymerase sigma factor (sigma-70 family)
LAPTSKAYSDAARKRVAVEIIAKHERALRQTARRYSLCAADADDAYQRALEILLTKAPTGDARELIRWTQTVTKHEALAVRRNRERLLSGSPPPSSEETEEDWMALIPAPGDGPAEKVERQEAIARSREALQALKPAELRALTLLAEGYSYAEIGEITSWSRTKVNRCLAEGRERFRALLSSSQDGSRCEELRPLLSAFCDGEAGAKDAALVREHLRACAQCRAAMRAYRAAPGAAAALTPLPPVALSLLDRFRDAIANHLAGGGGGASSTASGAGSASSASSSLAGSAASSSAAGSSAAAGIAGSAGTGVAALTKAVAVCATAVGGAAACVAVGVAPAPLDLAGSSAPVPIEREAGWPGATRGTQKQSSEEATSKRPSTKKSKRRREHRHRRDGSASAASSAVEPTPAPESSPPPEPVAELEPAPAPEPAPVPVSETSGAAGAAGEFGP